MEDLQGNPPDIANHDADQGEQQEGADHQEGLSVCVFSIICNWLGVNVNELEGDLHPVINEVIGHEGSLICVYVI